MLRYSFLLTLMCLPLLVGCEGCRSDSVADEDKEKEADKEDFTVSAPIPFPASQTIANGAIKPGHWLTAAESLRANNYDARGELNNTVGTVGVREDDQSQLQNGAIVPNQRPVVMPKGQMRQFNFRLLAPVPSSPDKRRCYLRSRFVSAQQGTYFDSGQQPYRIMSPEEYSMVILTSRPERFLKFRQGNWQRPPSSGFATGSVRRNYRIVVPKTDGVLPLADTMLDWTSTAVIVWDDLPTDVLTPDQQTALTDWVHFGGRLVLNGADAADSLVNTRLESLLALVPRSNITLDQAAAQELLKNWSVETDLSVSQQAAVIGSQDRISVDGDLAEGAKAIDRTSSLVVARRVGRGTVVQSRFDVTNDWVADWKSFDSFVNGVLLGRPKRAFRGNQDEGFALESYPSRQRSQASAAFNTEFRLLSRDASLTGVTTKELPASGSQRINPFDRIDPMTGLGGWTDTSDVLGDCQDLLRDESGIEIPQSDLVVKSLGIYLLFLVPINYLVFRLMGRLEYAWLAVPVIAIGGAVVIARAARLDIGFARSQNEVAVLELQPRYARGHLTRVLAIYNSLSSKYEIDFKTIDGSGAPIGLEMTDGIFKTSFEEGPSLSGIAVGSNRVGMLHMEEIVDVGGGIYLDSGGRLVNESQLDLADVFVVKRDTDGNGHIAVVGGCAAGQKSQLNFRQLNVVSISSELPMQTDQLIRRLASPRIIDRGAARLVGRFDGRIDGLTVSPASNQQMAQTVVVAHLQHVDADPPEIDDNLLVDIEKSLTEPE